MQIAIARTALRSFLRHALHAEGGTTDMNREDRLPEGQRLYKQAYKDAAPGRLFVALDADTMRFLSERAQGKPLGAVASELLRSLAQAEGSALYHDKL
jgi:hypothetical protein